MRVVRAIKFGLKVMGSVKAVEVTAEQKKVGVATVIEAAGAAVAVAAKAAAAVEEKRWQWR